MKKILYPSNPFLALSGTELFIVNAKGERTGESIFLKKDTDINLGFSQENDQGLIIHYKTIKWEGGKIFISATE